MNFDLQTLYLLLEIISLIIAISVIIFLRMPARILAYLYPITISSPVFEVSLFPMWTEHEFSVDHEKSLKGVPVLVHNRGSQRCIIDALWVEPSGRRGTRLPPHILLIPGYLESNVILGGGGQVEIRVVPDTIGYLEEICKSWTTDWCEICVSTMPYGVIRSRRFLYTNWAMYFYQILWGATRRTASALARKAAQDKKSSEEAMILLWAHWAKFMPEPLTSLVYAEMTLAEEVAKGTIPQAYLDHARSQLEEALKPIKDAYAKFRLEER
jgi:hypothetical protein